MDHLGTAGPASRLHPDELHDLLTAAALPASGGALLVGVGDGDDAAVVFLDASTAVVSTSDVVGPVGDDPYDWGRVAAADALSDVWAMGGRPVVALNLLAWPRDWLPLEVAAEVLRGGAATCLEAGCALGGGHTTVSAEPTYGLAVTGTVRPDRLLRNDAGVAGVPLTLTKPLGTGVLLDRHRHDGTSLDEAVEVMTTLNRRASEQAVAAGVRCATDVSGSGLLGHLQALCRASRVGAVVHAAAVPALAGAREALAAGQVPEAARRNLDWIRPQLRSALPEAELLLLADAQVSGGLLVVGELPGHPVVGRLVPDPLARIRVR